MFLSFGPVISVSFQNVSHREEENLKIIYNILVEGQ